ncbi:hypothetical protein [Streptomyces beijiangensis]|uniref:Uncharacterized protein n=1 Tax=Streptomyces beijiangensis TaxID=163361 RepID=A0A939F5X7_9ACTN|nr:hypothetical protein [Streptomyces beijiangensis]MBO0512099.1 hypothetical protein [Streptomyces beijiangensis]
MSDFETDQLLDTLRDSLDDVHLHTPVEEIVAKGRARRRLRRVTGVAAVALSAGLAVGVSTLANPSTAPPSYATSGEGVHVHTVAYTVDTQRDGTVHATFDKQRYFTDHAGLEAALRRAGFPVLIKTGVFCKGPNDDGKLSPSGGGAGVDRVMEGVREKDGRVTFIFKPENMPANTQLFIGYLNAAQLAAVHMNPGSVERLVPTDAKLICDSVAPPEHVYR